MSKGIPSALFVSLMLGLTGSVHADAFTYQKAFEREVAAFSRLNRISLARLNRDVHANCYIPVTIATVVLSDGSVRDVSIVTSSSVPVVDRYFLYIIEHAAPFQPLVNHYEPVPEQITITHEFRIDVRLLEDGVSSTRPCDEIKPRESQPG